MGSGQSGETEPAFDLFDRWLVNRQQQTDEEPTTPTVPSPGAAADAATSADDSVAADPVAADPVAADPVADDPVAAEADHAVQDPLFDESFVTDDSEPTVEEPSVESGVIVAPGVEDVVEVASARARANSTEAGRAIVAALAEPVELDPIAVRTDPETPADFEPTTIAPARKKAAKAARPTESQPEPDAARAVLAAVTADSKPDPVEAPARKPSSRAAKTQTKSETKSDTKPAREAVTREPLPEVTASRVRRTAAHTPTEGASTNVEFAPRNGTRRLVGVLLLVALAATVLSGYVAYQDQSTVNVGIAATLGVLTLVIWAARAGSSIAHLSVTRGQLEILRGGGRNVFDLSSRYTPIEVVGQPNERGWKVLFLRRSMSPFVIDASMVDPAEFMKVLRGFRPE